MATDSRRVEWPPTRKTFNSNPPDSPLAASSKRNSWARSVSLRLGLCFSCCGIKDPRSADAWMPELTETKVFLVCCLLSSRIILTSFWIPGAGRSQDQTVGHKAE
jgi:hypothetical protein